MIITFAHKQSTYQADLSKPIDISIPLVFNNLNAPNAWYCPVPEAAPQRFGTFDIAVAKGAAVNSYGVKIYPHGNGTHTESVGHILMDNFQWTMDNVESAKGQTDWISVNDALNNYHIIARLLSVFPLKKEDGDKVITKEQLAEAFEDFDNNPFDALIVRTMPNDDFKKTRQWSGSNPPYFEADALAYVAEKNIAQLLTDLPSVDKEDDGGKVAAHRAFWQVFDEKKLENTEGGMVRYHATITEMIYVPNTVKDGLYLLNLQIPSFEMDAAPSKPVLYSLFL
jgi:arylformamidase